jgi:gliding-associated putative ABC transporter substrate-binding component GldG
MASATYVNDSGARRARNLKYGTNVGVGTVLMFVILAAIVWFADRLQKRIDLTANKQYTTSKATEGLLKSLKDVVTVTVYATEKDTPPEWTEQRNQLRDLLYEYRLKSNRKVQYTFKDPSDTKVEEEAKKAGIRPQEMQQASMTEYSVKIGYLGFVVGYKGKTEVVPFIRPESSLEYQLTRAINKVAQVNIPVVGIMAPAGNPMMGEQSQYGVISEFLEQEGFTVKNLTADNLRDLKDVKMVMIFDPQDLSEEALFRLDQFVMNGGKLFVAAAGTQMSQRGEMTRATPKAPNINSILEHYGAHIDDNLLEDWKDGVPLQAITMSGQLVRYTNPFLMRTTDVSKDNPMTKNLPGLFFVYPSSVSKSTQGTSGTFEVLAQTSAKTRTQEQFFVTEPNKLKPPTAEEKLSPRNLVVSIKGPLASRYAMTDPPTLTEDNGSTHAVTKADVKTQSVHEAQVIVVGSSVGFTDQAIQRFQPNIIFPINVAEALTRGGDILSLRGKDLSIPVLREVTDTQARVTQGLIIIGVPAFLALVGFLKLFLNRRRRARYREVYGPRSAEAAV